MSRALEDLHPVMRAKAEAFLRLARERLGLELLVTHTYRSPDEQAALWAKGRDTDGKVIDPRAVVTNARPGDSAHNHRDADLPASLAFDVVPLTATGSAWWEAPAPVWQSLYKLAEHVGLDALGDKWGEYLSWDPGHFQLPGWRYV